MKKFFSFILCFLTIFFCAGCGKKDKEKEFVSYGQFYELKEVYEQGLISREQLLSVAYYGAKLDNEGLFDENYTPLSKTPEELSEKTVRKIKETTWYDYLEHLDEESRELELKYFEEKDKTFQIDYYGTYNGYVVMCRKFGCGLMMIVELEIDGIMFSYPDTSYRLLAWKEK